MNARYFRIHSYLTNAHFLHVGDALDIGKLKLFAGEYGEGGQATAYHFLDVEDARVIFFDLAWGRAVRRVDSKGTAGDRETTSRVLVLLREQGRVLFRLENGPGRVTAGGTIKPAGEPTTVVTVSLSVWEARKMAHAVLAHLAAWETITFRRRTQGQR